MTDAPRRRRTYELLIVLLLFWAPSVVGSFLYRGEEWDRTLPTELFSVLQAAGGICLLLYLARATDGTLRTVGLRRVRWWSELLWAFAVYCIVWVVLFVVFVFVLRFVAPDHRPPRDPLAGSLRYLMPAFFLVKALFEEMVCRAYLWTRLHQVLGKKWLAWILSALIFTAGHSYSWLTLLTVLVPGLVYGLLYWKWRSVPRLALAHWAHNMAIAYWI